MPSATRSISDFDGPIALLVELIERSQVKITAVSLEHITADYLESVSTIKQSDPGHLADFVQLGSRLTYIKSLALLPAASTEAAEELSALEYDLSEYRRYREAAQTLATRLKHARLYSRGAPYEHPESKLPLAIQLDQLSQAFQSALIRSRPLGHTTIVKHHIEVTTIMKSILSQLSRGKINLRHVIEKCSNRLEIIVTFLAILELLKNGSLTITQPNQFSDIILTPATV